MVDSNEERLRAFMRESDIEAEQLTFERSCHSVTEAAEAVGATPGDLVKNICLIAEDGSLVVAIVCGPHRVSTTRVGTALSQPPPRLASAGEILERSGYPVGGTPSFGFSARFVVDSKVLEQVIVYTGGGSPNSLVRVTPRELLRANRGLVARIRK